MKKYLITGLLIWIPLVITIWVLKLVVDTLDQSLLLLPEQGGAAMRCVACNGPSDDGYLCQSAKCEAAELE